MDHLLVFAVELSGRTAKYTHLFPPGSSAAAEFFSAVWSRPVSRAVRRARGGRRGRRPAARHSPGAHSRNGRGDVSASDERSRAPGDRVARSRRPRCQLDPDADRPPRRKQEQRAVVRQRLVARPVASVWCLLRRAVANRRMARLRPIELRRERTEGEAEADRLGRARDHVLGTSRGWRHEERGNHRCSQGEKARSHR